MEVYNERQKGVVLYFIPFFFVYNPSLIFRGELIESLYLFAFCVLGIMLIAGGLEGYLLGVGKLSIFVRPLSFTAGILLSFPEWTTTIIGAALAVILIAFLLVSKRFQQPQKAIVSGDE